MKKEIIEGNKLIALFMGGITSDMNRRIVGGYQNIWIPIHGICDWTTIELGRGKTVEYHSSWDWLMPVVEKIMNTKCYEEETYMVSISNDFVWIDQYIGDRVYFSGNSYEDRQRPLINKVWDACVFFIKYYNNKNK